MNMRKTALAFGVALCATVSLGGRLTEKIAKRHTVRQTDMWYGGERTVFDFEGYDAWVVEPPSNVVVAAGNPWTWTMQWRTAFVSRTGVPRLLAQGWHHVSVDTFKDRMDARGLAVSRKFHDYLVRELGFDRRARLIGMSWGGFFSVRYAAANPDRVAKIYLDAPFLNFDGYLQRDLSPEAIGSWSGRHAFGEWTDDPEMPVNMASTLADARIPILLLYGGKDSVLQPTLNSELFAARYRAKGGQIKVVCRKGFDHHPHGVDSDDDIIIDFMTGKVPGCDE